MRRVPGIRSIETIGNGRANPVSWGNSSTSDVQRCHYFNVTTQACAFATLRCRDATPFQARLSMSRRLVLRTVPLDQPRLHQGAAVTAIAQRVELDDDLVAAKARRDQPGRLRGCRQAERS
jgi:hypothetical protein